MIFTIQDTGITLSQYPSCNAFAVNGITIQGKLSCQTQGNNIYLKGISASIPALQSCGISISMINPKVSGKTLNFDMYILRADTTAVYDQKTSIPGVPITPGKISNIALTLNNPIAIQAKGKIMDYKLTFLPKNPLPAGSVISLEFPVAFPVVTGINANTYIISGLQDISETSTVGMNLAGTTLDITNFQPQSIPSLITLQLRLTNPTNPGVTTPIQITTYQDSTKARPID